MSHLFFQIPSGLRLLAAIAITVGITVFVVWRFHDRIIVLGSGGKWPYEPPQDEDDEKDEDSEETEEEREEKEEEEKEENAAEEEHPKPAASQYLAQRVGQWTGMAFVFMLAFTLSNLWSNGQDVRSGIRDETLAYQSAVAAAQYLPAAARDTTVAGLREYADREQAMLPLLQQADVNGAIAAQQEASLGLAATLSRAAKEGGEKAETWATLTSQSRAMMDASIDRIGQLPGPQVPGVIMLLFILAITTLAITAAYQSASLGSNMVLMGVMAAVVALLLFWVVEISNPYQGGTASTPTIGATPGR